LADVAVQDSTLVDKWNQVAPNLTGDSSLGRYARAISLVEDLPLEALILDVGCGQGLMSQCLSNLGYTNIVAFDISPVLAKITLARKSGVMVLVADVQHLPFRDRIFKAAFACETIEHWQSPSLGLKEIQRALDGKLVISTDSYLYHYFHLIHVQPFEKSQQPIEDSVSPIVFEGMPIISFHATRYSVPMTIILGLTTYVGLNRVRAFRKIAFRFLKATEGSTDTLEEKIRCYRETKTKAERFPTSVYKFHCLSIALCFDYSQQLKSHY
jgi:SAM-dependent methyltransferase